MNDTESGIAEAPLPTARTLRERSNVSYQVLRFLAFNLKMLRMVKKGHN